MLQSVDCTAAVIYTASYKSVDECDGVLSRTVWEFDECTRRQTQSSGAAFMQTSATQADLMSVLNTSNQTQQAALCFRRRCCWRWGFITALDRCRIYRRRGGPSDTAGVSGPPAVVDFEVPRSWWAMRTGWQCHSCCDGSSGCWCCNRDIHLVVVHRSLLEVETLPWRHSTPKSTSIRVSNFMCMKVETLIYTVFR